MRPGPLAAVVLTLALAAPIAAQSRREHRDEALHRTFFQASAAHFTMLFEGPQDHELASRALDVLERAYFRIGSALGGYPDDIITVVLYTQEQFRDITRAPAWAAAAYDGKIRIPIRGALSRAEELERVLSHELAHAFVRTCAPQGVPTWLNEGIAAYFEPQGVEWAAEQLAASSKRLPMRRLARDFSSLSGDDARLAYAQSASLVSKLFEEGGGWSVQAMLRDLASGSSFENAFERRLLLPYEAFLSSLWSAP